MLLVGGLVVRMKVELDGGHAEVVLTLGVRDEGPDAFASIALLVVPLQHVHDGAGRLVALLVGEQELASSLPDAALWGMHGGVHEGMEEPLVRRHVRGRHAVQGLVHSPGEDVAKLALLSALLVARAGPGGAAGLQQVLAAIVGGGHALPAHQLPQLAMCEEAALRKLDRLQQPRRLLNEGRVDLAHLGARDLSQEAGVPLLLHGVEQGLLLCQPRELLSRGAPHDHEHLGVEVRADGHVRNDSFAGRGHAVTELQTVSMRNDTALPVGGRYEVQPLAPEAEARGGAGG
mmetsp:Transcript_11632/g.32809  ORF Transcript_11632/g.32809 Transcript_11632/m.32809 type:complete len:289 (-) Transcript_11632:573-1439(-)